MRAGNTPVLSARERASGSSYPYVYSRHRNTGPYFSKLADHAGERAGGRGVEALWHAAGEVGFAAGDDGIAHGFGHEDGVLGFGNGGVHEDAIGAKLHGNSGVGSRAHAGIDDHGNFSDAFAEDAEVGGILHAEARADGRGE